jgi:transposase-like protein
MTAAREQLLDASLFARMRRASDADDAAEVARVAAEIAAMQARLGEIVDCPECEAGRVEVSTGGSGTHARWTDCAACAGSGVRVSVRAAKEGRAA